MTTKSKGRKGSISPQDRIQSQPKTSELTKEMALDELRLARELTQQRLAEALQIRQSAISKLERRTDMYLSTLSKMIQAMGGKLEIRAVFPEGEVRIRHFTDLGVKERDAKERPASDSP